MNVCFCAYNGFMVLCCVFGTVANVLNMLFSRCLTYWGGVVLLFGLGRFRVGWGLTLPFLFSLFAFLFLGGLGPSEVAWRATSHDPKPSLLVWFLSLFLCCVYLGRGEVPCFAFSLWTKTQFSMVVFQFCFGFLFLAVFCKLECFLCALVFSSFEQDWTVCLFGSCFLVAFVCEFIFCIFDFWCVLP